jgi:hypothetical protein
MPAIRASFRNEMIDNAMIFKFLQPESDEEPNEWLAIWDGITFVHYRNLVVPLNWLLHAPHHIDHS